MTRTADSKCLARFYRIAAFASCVALAALCAQAQDEPGYKPGPLHYKTCVDTTVVQVHPRKFIREPNGSQFLPLSNYGYVEFATRLGEESVTAERYVEKANGYDVVHYHPNASIEFGDSPDAEVAAAERTGDRVQVCLLTMPAPSQSCNPDIDPRGRVYRVWDYRQRAAYSGASGEHACGGA